MIEQNDKIIIGVDVGYKTSSICVLYDRSQNFDMVVVDTSPSKIIDIIDDLDLPIKAIAFESGNLSHHLADRLLQAGWPALIIDARRAAPFLRSIKAAKTDNNDAYAIAELVRRQAHVPVWIKSAEAVQLMTLVSLRNSLVKSELILRGTLLSHIRARGKKVKAWSRKQYLSDFKTYLENSDDKRLLSTNLDILVRVDRQIQKLDDQIQKIAKASDVCRLLMTVPGVGPKTAVLYRAVVDNPDRFERSRDVGAYLGLIPRVRQSGGITRRGSITKAGSAELRRCLFMASMTLLFTSKQDLAIRRWGLRIAQRRGKKRAIIAVSRKLAVTMHAVWRSGTPFQPHD